MHQANIFKSFFLYFAFSLLWHLLSQDQFCGFMVFKTESSMRRVNRSNIYDGMIWWKSLMAFISGEKTDRKWEKGERLLEFNPLLFLMIGQFCFSYLPQFKTFIFGLKAWWNKMLLDCIWQRQIYCSALPF